MAEVYLAEQVRLKRRVAVKILKPELAGDRTYLQRFELEAQAAASLIHANIVQIYEVGCVDQLHYIAQEYVQGQNLRDYLARHGPPDLSHALSIMRQAASALAKAAEQGVVHRDIKPENIMLTAGGEVKVADFGLARLTHEGAANDLTQVGMTLGTPLYMSPEQVEGRPLDPRSDIYSFGVTCYQMLSGSPPFVGETALGVAVQHLKSRPKPLEAIRPDLPPMLCRIVHRMLAKSPSERFESARELLRELRRLQIEHFGDEPFQRGNRARHQNRRQQTGNDERRSRDAGQPFRARATRSQIEIGQTDEQRQQRPDHADVGHDRQAARKTGESRHLHPEWHPHQLRLGEPLCDRARNCATLALVLPCSLEVRVEIDADKCLVLQRVGPVPVPLGPDPVTRVRLERPIVNLLCQGNG